MTINRTGKHDANGNELAFTHYRKGCWHVLGLRADGTTAYFVPLTSKAQAIARIEWAAVAPPDTLVIRIAEAPCGASSAFLHPACCGDSLHGVEYHDLTIVQLLEQQIIYCDGCGERIVPAGVSLD